MTSADKCEDVVAEVEEILESYDMFDHDKDIIIGSIRSAYFMLAESYKAGRQMEAFIRDELGDDGIKRFTRIILGHDKPTGEHLKAEC